MTIIICTGCQKLIYQDEVASLHCVHVGKLNGVPFHVECLLEDAAIMYRSGDAATHVEAAENMEAVYDYFIDQSP